MTDTLDGSRDEGRTLDYWHATITSRPAPDGIEELHVPAGTWVVLTSSGVAYPEGLQLMRRDAYTEWFPANPWRTRPGPELLRTEFDDDDTANGELWLPVEPSPA